MKILTGVFSAMTFVLSTSALAQNQNPPAPSAQECIAAHPELCVPPAKRTIKRPAKRRPSSPTSRVTGIDITGVYQGAPGRDGTNAPAQDPETRSQLNGLREDIHRIEGLLGNQQNIPAAQLPPPEPTVVNVHNHYEQPPAPQASREDESNSRFSVDLGGLLSVRQNSRREVSPGGRVGARIRVGSLLLGVQGSYERVEYEDASVIEDFIFEPVARYEFLNGPLRPFAQLSLGYWTERIVWMGPTSCGDASCPPGERNSSFTSMAALGLSMYPWRNVSVSIEPLALRWVPVAEADRPMWSFSPSASVSLHIP